MVSDLIAKEFKQNATTYASKKSALLSYLLRFVLYAFLIAIEVFIYIFVDKKIVEYSHYGSLDFFVLFMFVVFVVTIVTGAIKTRNIFFNRNDDIILSPLPISDDDIIFSKVVYIYMNLSINNLLIGTPLIITYLAINSLNAFYFIFSIVYPFAVSLFALGASLVLGVVFEIVYRTIKNLDILQFILASIFTVALCYAYQIILNLFLTALSDGSIGGVFTEDFVLAIHNVVKYFVPVYSIFDPLFGHENIVPNFLIGVGSTILSLVVGYFVINFFYDFLNRHYYERNGKDKTKQIKVLSINRSLIKKECDLLFKDSNSVFQYTALLIMAPFLTFVVVSSLNSIVFSSLKIYSVYFPELFNGINLTLILLFTSVINTNAAMSISREGRTIQVMKYLPVSIIKQVSIKLLVPITLSSISLVISIVVLLSTDNIGLNVFFTTIFLGLVLIVFSNFFGVYLEMHDKCDGKNKMISLNSFVGIFFPFVVFILHFILSITKVQTEIIYVVDCLLGLILLIPLFLNPKKRYQTVFDNMEVD